MESIFLRPLFELAEGSTTGLPEMVGYFMSWPWVSGESGDQARVIEMDGSIFRLN